MVFNCSSKFLTNRIWLHELLFSISMDGRGRCQDNIFVERLWWTLKHQYIYLHSFDSAKSLQRGLAGWIQYYNQERGHSSLDDRTPDEVYYGLPHPFAEAA